MSSRPSGKSARFSFFLVINPPAPLFSSPPPPHFRVPSGEILPREFFPFDGFPSALPTGSKTVLFKLSVICSLFHQYPFKKPAATFLPLGRRTFLFFPPLPLFGPHKLELSRLPPMTGFDRRASSSWFVFFLLHLSHPLWRRPFLSVFFGKIL